MREARGLLKQSINRFRKPTPFVNCADSGDRRLCFLKRNFLKPAPFAARSRPTRLRLRVARWVQPRTHGPTARVWPREHQCAARVGWVRVNLNRQQSCLNFIQTLNRTPVTPKQTRRSRTTLVGFCVRPVLAHAESAAAARLSEGGLRPTSFGNPSVLAGRSRPRRGVRSGRRVERSRGRLASAR